MSTTSAVRNTIQKALVINEEKLLRTQTSTQLYKPITYFIRFCCCFFLLNRR